jgi:hypothetical protein
MEVVLKNWFEDVLTELRSTRTEGYIKQYKQAAERYLRVGRQHGPYQMAMLICNEVVSAKDPDSSPKLLLHDHIFKFLGYKEGWLVTALSEEPDPVKRLEQVSQMMLFLMRIRDHL